MRQQENPKSRSQGGGWPVRLVEFVSFPNRGQQKLLCCCESRDPRRSTLEKIAMKKSVLALAVLGAFAGATSAQSSVTLYGRLDTAVSYSDLEIGDEIIGMNGTGWNPIGGSRWGLRGSEDVGGGLKVNFVLESGFGGDTGAGNAAKLFDRQARVGLSSATWGEIRLGRQDTLTRTTNLGFSDITAEGEITIVDTVGGVPLFQNFSSRVDNSVGYFSPSFGGLSVAALVAAGEGTAPRQQGVMVSYSGGPLKLALTYEGFDAGPASSSSYNEVLTVGGSYNFGFATLSLGYQSTDDFGTPTSYTPGTDHNAYAVGVMVPFGAFQFRAQYIDSTVEAPAGDIDAEKFGLSLRYALSKRTTVYGVYQDRDSEGTGNYAKSVFAIGIGHNF
jgi:GBP family porin